MDIIIPPHSIPLKRCPMCPEDNQWHPATSEFFYHNKKSRDGFNTPCKRCQQEGRKHRIEILPQGYKQCTKCKEIKPLEGFSPLDKSTLAKLPINSKQLGRKSSCRACRVKENKDYRKRPGYVRKQSNKNYKRNPRAARRSKYKQNYGITYEEYQALFEKQNGVCAVCGNPETAILKRTGRLKHLAVDHCHITGRIRGLLCGSCNQAFGCLKEDPERIRALLVYAETWHRQK